MDLVNYPSPEKLKQFFFHLTFSAMAQTHVNSHSEDRFTYAVIATIMSLVLAAIVVLIISYP